MVIPGAGHGILTTVDILRAAMQSTDAGWKRPASPVVAAGVERSG
jgi:hypothetical protein